MLVKMGLATGLRRDELAAMRWDGSDREDFADHGPGQSDEERLRACRSDRIPDRAAAQRNAQPRRRASVPERSAPRRRDANVGLVEDDDLAAPSVRRGGVSLHDIMRTNRSALADRGVREEITEAMIAHRRSNLVSRYNRAQLWDQRREAAEKLHAWLSGTISRIKGNKADDVVPLASVKRV